MLVQITGTYQEETVVNEYTFLACMFFFLSFKQFAS